MTHKEDAAQDFGTLDDNSLMQLYDRLWDKITQRVDEETLHAFKMVVLEIRRRQKAL